LTQISLWLPLKKLLSSIAISATVAIVTTLAALAICYVLFPVTGIEVRGARMFSQSEAWEAVPYYASLLSLNTEVLERRVKSNPWVKDAKVIKDWESGIVTVEVEERRAVLDGDLGGRPVVLAADGTELPGLGGASLKRVELDEVQLEEIMSISEVLEENGVTLDSVDRVGAGGFEATVENHPVLFAGEVGETQAQALADFVEKQSHGASFDLRSPNRIVVGTESGDQSRSSDG
jgi:hypothetical protein